MYAGIQYVFWGSDSAIFDDNFSCSSIHVVILNSVPLKLLTTFPRCFSFSNKLDLESFGNFYIHKVNLLLSFLNIFCSLLSSLQWRNHRRKELFHILIHLL